MTKITVKVHFDTIERLSAITFKKEKIDNAHFCQLNHLQEGKALQFHTHNPQRTCKAFTVSVATTVLLLH